MAATIGSLQLNHNLNYVFTSFDPTSLILSQFSNSHQPHTLHLTTQSFSMERGSRYEEYAALRESRLRMKNMKNPIQEKREEFQFHPNSHSQKKQVKSPGNLIKGSKGSSSVSVPEFGKKENRRPATIPEKPTTTPAMRSRSGTYDGIMGRVVGNKSVEKKSGNNNNGGGGGFMARKSYASLEVLKGLGSQARRAINGESKGLRTPRRNCSLDKTEFAYSIEKEK